MKKFQGKIIILFMGIASMLFLCAIYFIYKNQFDTITLLFLIIIILVYITGIIFSFFQQKIIDNESSNHQNTIRKNFFQKITASNQLNSFEAVDSYYIIYEQTLRRYFSVISSISSILITLGLIGTIFGLIVSMGGLKTLVTSSGNNAAILSNMTNVLSGVDISFYTTLLGSFLGGILLRVCLIIHEHSSQIVLNNVKIKWLEKINTIVPNVDSDKNIDDFKKVMLAFRKLHFQLASQIKLTNNELLKFHRSLNDISKIPIHNKLSVLSDRMEENTNYFKKTIEILLLTPNNKEKL